MLTTLLETPPRTLLLGRAWFVFPLSVGILAALGWTSFLFFHVLVELFVVLASFTMGIVAWTTYPFSRNHFLAYLGSGYFWLGLLELLHILVYPKMGILPDAPLTLSSQLWIAARAVEALLLLTSPWFLHHPFTRQLNGWIAAAVLLLGGLALTGWFPVTFIPGQGLTPFKVVSEYVIMAVLGVTALRLYRQRRLLDGQILLSLLWSIGLGIAAELSFTLYINFFDASNIFGHLLKLSSIWLIFETIILIMLRQPFRILAQGSSSFDAMPDPVLLVDEAGLIRQTNLRAVELAGLPEHRLLGRSCHSLFHPVDPPPDECTICSHIREGIPLPSTEFHLPQRDEWWEITLRRLRTGDAYQGMIHISRNITQRKRAEAERRVHETRKQWLASIFSVSPDSISILGPDLTYLAVNDTYLRNFQKKRQEIEGQQVAKVLEEVFIHAVRPHLAKALGGEAVRHQKEFVFPGAGARWMDMLYHPLLDGQQRVTGILVHGRDITELKQAEQALKAAEERHRTILDSAGDGILVLDLEERCTFANAAALATLGWDADALHDSHLHTRIHHTRPDGAPYPVSECPIHATLQDGQTRHGDEDWYWRHNGEAFPVEYTIAPLFQNGLVSGVVVVFRDISVRLRQAREKQLLHDQALHSARLATLGTLAAGIAHEINNPNNAIAVNANLLRGVWRDAQAILAEYHAEHGDFSLGGLPYEEMRNEAPRLLVSLEENAQRIKTIISNMKHLAQVPAQELRRLELRGVVEKSVSILQTQIAKRTHQFTLTLAPGGLLVRGNPSQLEQVLINLILNALQALPDESRSVSVTLAQDETRQEVRVIVQDQGRGIAPEHLDKLGEPFFSTRHTEGGLGLGLSICRAILNAHGATMTFVSTPEQGTQVTLSFPAAHEEQD